MKKLVVFWIVFLILLALSFAQEEVANESTNESFVQNENIEDFEIVSFEPNVVVTGDVVFDMQIKNTGNVELRGLVPVIIGKGFATYDVSTISVLKPGQKSHLTVLGRLSEVGTILLTIKIKDKIFYQTIEVGSSAPVNTNLSGKEGGRKTEMELLSQKIEELKNKYDSLEEEMLKKKDNYDLSAVSLSDLKSHIRNAESALLGGDVLRANISITLAFNEYADQKKNLDHAPKKPFLMILKENALIISAIAGSVLTLFALYELIKKKQEGLYKKIKEIKIIEKEPRQKIHKKENNNK